CHKSTQNTENITPTRICIASECGIPALVCAKNATQLLETGMLVTLDGRRGEIRIHEEE
ncbi:PEP-utilizing enzyme, partial [Streptococcus gordonii]|uniref:PEP-utilizing enzyme n=1 Tax=Streptococcus gordonii TaxID=1302 RepID=UPI003BF587EF